MRNRSHLSIAILATVLAVGTAGWTLPVWAEWTTMEDPLRGRIVLTKSLAAEHTGPEVLVQLVLATVFKTVGPHGNHVAGGFDSHALPPE